jgi:hypothetical protein
LIASRATAAGDEPIAIRALEPVIIALALLSPSLSQFDDRKHHRPHGTRHIKGLRFFAHCAHAHADGL